MSHLRYWVAVCVLHCVGVLRGSMHLLCNMRLQHVLGRRRRCIVVLGIAHEELSS